MKKSEIRGSAKALMSASSSADGANKFVYILAWLGGVVLLFAGVNGWSVGQGFLIAVAIAAVVQATLVFLVINAFTAKMSMDANIAYSNFSEDSE